MHDVTVHRISYAYKLARLLPDPTCITAPSIMISCFICSSLVILISLSLQAERMGDSFVVEYYVSNETKAEIRKVVRLKQNYYTDAGESQISMFS